MSRRFTKAEAHLARADPVMARLVRAHGPCPAPRRRAGAPFPALCRIVVAQMLSTRAARTVSDRLVARLDGEPTPAAVLDLGSDGLRAVGLSRAKAGALVALAEGVRSGDLPLERLTRWPSPRVAAALTEVPGVGPWTANVFLLWFLGRPDVFPARDLGVLEGIRRAYGLAARPKPAEAVRRAEPWAPHRSTAARLLWRAVDAGDAP